jgi:hypothetical protein
MSVKIAGCLLTGRTKVLDSAADPAVPHHLLSPVEYMRTHGGQSLDGIKDLLVFSVCRRIDFFFQSALSGC